jgi:hypothetical protein
VIGDVHSAHEVKANGAYLDVKPASAGELWRVRGIYFSTQGVAEDIEVVRTDGANEIELEKSGADVTGYIGMPWVVSSTTWIRIKNTSGVSQTLGYDAIEIHVAA